MCILVVEDDPVLGTIYKRILRKLGRNATVAQDGVEAIKYAGSNKYDLILMDVGLPGHDGLEVTRQLRRMGIDVPIVAVTAGHSSKAECLKAGISDYFIKPLMVEQLESILDRYNLFHA